MDYNANMNTVRMDPRSYPLGAVRSPGMMPPVMGRHHPMPMTVHRLPHGMGPGPPPMPGQGVYVEEHMVHLEGKLDMLENELRYAWKALDVLSQEYIKMWERLEKMEGLLTEQQTVITQLIDLYTADSSDNADNSFDTDGGGGGGFGGKDADEAFYKALNVVHRDSYPQTVDNSLTVSYNTANDGVVSGESAKLQKTKTGKVSPAQYVNSKRNIADVEMMRFNAANQPKIDVHQGHESDMEIRSMTSSVRSVQSGMSEIGEFPVPEDTSPSYENLVPTPGNMMNMPPPSGMPAPVKRKLPQVPGPVPDSRRTRQDGYIGESDNSKNNSKAKQAISHSIDAQSHKNAGNKKNKPKDLSHNQNVMVAKSQGSSENVQKQTAMTTILEQETQYDTYPRRKNKKEKGGKPEATGKDSPLTVIDGNYSFSLSEDNVRDQTQFFDDDDEQETTIVENLTGRKEKVKGENDQQFLQSIVHNNKVKKPITEPTTQSHTIIDNGSQSGNLLSRSLSGNGSEPELNQLSEPLTRANSLFQQIQAREPDPSLVKTRKLSLKEKRKLRTEQRELVSEMGPKTIEEHTQQQQVTLKKPDSSESDVSMRSDHSISPKRETDDGLEQSSHSSNGVFMGEQHVTANGTRPRSNGINLLPVQQQILASSKSSSREFAVSRALGKYRQKQKKERESFQGSSNSDSQEELDLQAEFRGEPGFDGTIRSIDAKLANIEEQTNSNLMNETKANPQLVVKQEIVQKQVSEFENTGFAPFDVDKKSLRGIGSRRQSTEESIDSEDEWYQHEIMRLQRLEYEQEMQKVIPSESVGERMSSVLGELHEKVPEIKEDLKGREKERLHNEEEIMKKEPPDDPKPPDGGIKGEKEKGRKTLKRLSTSENDDDESSDTSGADDDSDTQSGADTIDEEDEDIQSSIPDVSKRPVNLTILPTEQKLNISDRQPKPDLLEEVTAAAAEAAFNDAFPDHLKNGYYGEDGAWYDEQGETGYQDEDGTWYDYIDEIGYTGEDGEWIEYDYTKGHWGEDGEWHENTDGETTDAQKNETDHFLWVSEERINGKYSNDQILSSELNNTMVIGRLPSGLSEETNPDLNYIETESLPSSEPSKNGSSKRESFNEYQVEETQKNQIVPTNEPEKEEEKVVIRNKGTGGKRWGALVKQRKSDLIELVRI